ncbi:hypothetical protein HK096_004031, partial [Nowakowskiella sp. JEL0078]
MSFAPAALPERATSLPPSVTVVDHPLVAHKLSLLRDVRVKPKQFRELVNELCLLIGFEATRGLDLIETKILDSPVNSYQGVTIKDKIGIFPILRAGLGLVDAFLTLVPSARVHHLGIYRDKSTLLPVEYYNKLPAVCTLDTGILLDPMIATAGTALAAVGILKDWGLKLENIKLIAIMASLDGVLAVAKEFPEVQIYVACVDQNLTDKGYIDPGLGDAGDRL